VRSKILNNNNVVFKRDEDIERRNLNRVIKEGGKGRGDIINYDWFS
jgi:hypothetical protein